MKIIVLGNRGFPNIQGGIEKHCEQLYPELVKLGCEVVFIARKPYVGKDAYKYNGVKIIPVYCPRNKFLEAFVHTFLGVLQARQLNCNFLHIHAIGPSMFIPLARVLGLKVVMTHHGPDYQRAKWNRQAKWILRIGEYCGVRFANEVIVISQTIAQHIEIKFSRTVSVIPNGVVLPPQVESEDALARFGLKQGKYILVVGRFVPEKGFHDLIEAFTQLQIHNSQITSPNAKLLIEDWKLVIVGDADHEDTYSRQLKEQAKKSRNVIMTGFLSGNPLQELYSHAGLFVLPSYYEGLPIVLLEAMSYGLSCIVSDISANREVGLGQDRYFKPGDIDCLCKKIQEFISKPLSQLERQNQIDLIREKYDWEKIAQKTLGVYHKVLNCPARG